MSTFHKGFGTTILLIILALLIGAGGTYMYMQNQNKSASTTADTSVVATSTASTTQTNTETQAQNIPTNKPTNEAAAGMSKYTDTEFGFSFWYPSNWKVTTSKDIGGTDTWTDLKNIQVGDLFFKIRKPTEDGTFFASAAPLTDFKSSDITGTTMGGLYLYKALKTLYGGGSQYRDVAVQIDQSHIIYAGGPTTDSPDSLLLLRTIVKTNAGSTQILTTEQKEVILAEAKAYGISNSSNVSAASQPLPTEVGKCSTTAVVTIGVRLYSGSINQPVPGSGSSISYGNGGHQISYDQIDGIDTSKVGDNVQLCLVSIPQDCPPGDDRGRVYVATNLRTGKTWSAADSSHMCGGA